jgi:ParB family transcriptional regulator, chromosome partitioning protein
MPKKQPNRMLDKITQGFSRVGSQQAPRIVELRLDEVVPNPAQPRKYFDEEKLAELASSIERHGLLQPIAVQKLNGQYVIVAGERRYRAHQRLGRETVNAVVVTGDPQELALIENLQRENLRPIEEAEGLASLMESYGYTQEALSEVVGKSRVTVAETLRLNDLPEPIKEECRALDIPKLMLLQVVRVEDEGERQQLWEDVKTGTVKTLRQAQARRKTVTKARREPAQGAQARLQPLLASGRTFVRWLGVISDEDLSQHQQVYAELAELERDIAQRLAQARQSIGEPQLPEEKPPEAAEQDGTSKEEQAVEQQERQE